MTEKILLNKMIKLHQTKQPNIIAICGAADLGKSFLTKSMTQQLCNQQIDSHHLTLDSFLLDRSERKRKGWSGYQTEAHDLVAIKNTLALWKNGETISYQPYDHKTGTIHNTANKIPPSDILLVEGLFALHPLFEPFIDLSIFIHTSDDFLKKIKLEADLIKRNYTAEHSRAIYDAEFKLYQKNIAPFKENADVLLYLERKWIYKTMK